jgi:hypothetical protein
METCGYAYASWTTSSLSVVFTFATTIAVARYSKEQSEERARRCTGRQSERLFRSDTTPWSDGVGTSDQNANEEGWDDVGISMKRGGSTTTAGGGTIAPDGTFHDEFGLVLALT